MDIFAPNLCSVQPKNFFVYMQDTRKINHMGKDNQLFMCKKEGIHG